MVQQIAAPPGMSSGLAHVTVAIPVRNEAARLPTLLAALAVSAARSPWPVTAVVLANNCTDDSVAIAGAFRDPALHVAVHAVTFPTPDASAGRARRVAMAHAARPGGMLMTTDADAVPCAGWIGAAADSLLAGADLVCGPLTADVPHVLATPSGARITRAEEAYAAILHRIRHRLDQVAGRQPLGWPRPHYMESGASMAMRADAYLAVGGLPERDAGEDRAMVVRAEAHGLRVRYAPDMRVHVSARLDGRADGGMAACLRHRMQDDDPMADQAMLPPDALRALWADAMAGAVRPYPDRGAPAGPPLRASDLEALLPDLSDLYHLTIRPDFAAWAGRRVPMAAQ